MEGEFHFFSCVCGEGRKGGDPKESHDDADVSIRRRRCKKEESKERKRERAFTERQRSQRDKRETDRL